MPVQDNDNKWNLLQAKLNETKVCNAFEIFDGSDVEPILLKGFAAAQYYPPEVGRAYVDVDLAVAPEKFDRANDLIKTSKVNNVIIDLHRGFRHLDTVSWDELIDRSEFVELNGKSIRVLSAEDHLRVMCVHWLTDGAENKERLWDIYYAVENRRSDFDWDKCLSVVAENRQCWVKYTIGLAHKFLNLDISDLPFKEEALNLPRWFPIEVKKHWDANNPIVPLAHCLHDREKFWNQVKKRIPPNPIFSTVYMDGRLDAKTRVFYQIGNFFARLLPSLRIIGANKFKTRRHS